MARFHLGPRGGAIHAGPGLPPARARLATPLRCHLRPGGARRASGASPRPRWRCPTIPTWPTSSSGPCWTAATSGCWSRNTRWNSPDGRGVERPHLPHRLVCTDSHGQHGEHHRHHQDPGQRHQARGARCSPTTRPRASARWELAGRRVPPLVTQIADGENGGVMMNEFPPKYLEVMRECSGSATPADERHRVPRSAGRGWASAARTCHLCSRFSRSGYGSVSKPGEGPERLAAVIEELGAGRRPVQHGGRQLDQQHLMGARVRERAGADGACELALQRELARQGVPYQRPPLPATRSSTCWPVKPAATATGARASGRTTARSSPAAPAMPQARWPERQAAPAGATSGRSNKRPERQAAPTGATSDPDRSNK